MPIKFRISIGSATLRVNGQVVGAIHNVELTNPTPAEVKAALAPMADMLAGRPVNIQGARGAADARKLGGHLTRGEVMQKDAVFSSCRQFRWSLSRIWDDRPPMLVIGLNPSTADENTDDPTIRRDIGFARREGCGGLIKCNLFGWRSTDPLGLLATDDPVGEANADYIAAAALKAGVVVAAWGAGKPALAKLIAERGAHTLALLKTMGVAVKCFGLTGAGLPKHPLYLKATTPLAAAPEPDWEAIPFSLSCTWCDAQAPNKREEADKLGWRDIEYNDGAGFNFLGTCPTCARDEAEQARTWADKTEAESGVTLPDDPAAPTAVPLDTNGKPSGLICGPIYIPAAGTGFDGSPVAAPVCGSPGCPFPAAPGRPYCLTHGVALPDDPVAGTGFDGSRLAAAIDPAAGVPLPEFDGSRERVAHGKGCPAEGGRGGSCFCK
jgi:hypothetical protein